MKSKKFLIATFACLFVISSSSVFAQKGNPLQNIPVTISVNSVIPYPESASMSVTDFSIVNNKIVVSSVLSGFSNPAIPDILSKATVENLTASCVELKMDLVSTNISNLVAPTTINTGEFTISPVSLIISNNNNRDARITNALCSIAELNGSNASLNTIVAKLKQLLRAF